LRLGPLLHPNPYNSSLVSPESVSLINHVTQMLGSRSASGSIQLKSASKQKHRPTLMSIMYELYCCVYTSHHLRSMSMTVLFIVCLFSGPFLTTLCPAMLYTQWVDSCKLHIPGSCAYWFPDGFIQWETLSRAQGQEKQRRQAILLSSLF